MKSCHSLLAVSLLVGAALSTDGADIPTRANFDRYKAMLDKPLFAVATAQVVAAAPPNFAKDLYVANASHFPDGDMVTIMSATDRNMKEYVSTNEPNERGYKIVSIEWSELPGGTKVTVQKDGQVATLSFNQALMSQAPVNPPNPAQPGGVVVPNTVPPPPPVGYAQPKPAAIPNMPSPPAPRVRSVIPRPGGATPNVPNGNNPGEIKE